MVKTDSNMMLNLDSKKIALDRVTTGQGSANFSNDYLEGLALPEVEHKEQDMVAQLMAIHTDNKA